MNNFKNTIKKMLYSNQEVEQLLYDNINISSNNNRVANIELFFLTFKLFKEEFDKLDIYDKYKESINKDDYYIIGDKIYLADQEISFHLLEILFRKTLEQHNKNIKSKIINMPNRDNTNIDIIDNTNKKDKIINITDIITTADTYEEEAIRQISTYKIEDCISTNYYLSKIKNNFKDITYDSILNLYKILKESRQDKLFKKDIPYIDEESINKKYNKDLIIFLLDFYTIQYYSKDKIEMKYEDMEISNIEVDANKYRYDDEWTKLNNEYDEINKRIERLGLYQKKFRFMEPKDYKKLPFIIATLEMRRREVLEELLDLSLVRETELVDDDEYFESYYSGELYNKHILYNLEVALNNGHVDFTRKHNKDMIVFYAIVGDEVDYILEVELDKIKNVIDTICLKETIEDKKVLTYC